jgi:hypothetical protein
MPLYFARFSCEQFAGGCGCQIFISAAAPESHYTYRRCLQDFSKGVRYSSHAIRSTFINPANAQQQPRSDNNFCGLRLNL